MPHPLPVVPPPRSTNRHVVNEVVEPGLCVRCGACQPACPVDIIRFADDGFPRIADEAACIETCTRCLKVCPGREVDFLQLDREMFGRHPHPDSVTGIVRGAYVCHATDEWLREHGTSGGMVSQLLRHLLRSGAIDGALVLAGAVEDGAWRERPVLARTAEEIVAARKSKYLLVPFLGPLGEMERVAGRYAVVALPCQVHAVRKYQRVSKRLRERVTLVIGLYCNVALEPYAAEDLYRLAGIPGRRVRDVDFRAGRWPGGITARLDDGTRRPLLRLEEMKDQFNTLKLLYTPSRCNLCVDFSAEYADLAVGDPWLRGPDGSYLFPDNRTTVLVRTDAGARVLADAVARGVLAAEPLPLETYMVNFEQTARYKRDFVPKTMALRRWLRRPVPVYHRPIGSGGGRGWLPMIARHAVLGLARSRGFRRLALTLLQSRPALAYYAWNRRRKAGRFARRYAAALRLVERITGGTAP